MHGKTKQVNKNVRDKGKEKLKIEDDSNSDSLTADSEQEEPASIPSVETNNQFMLTNTADLSQNQYSQGNKIINQVTVIPDMRVGCSGSVKVGDITMLLQPSVNSMQFYNPSIGQFNTTHVHLQPSRISMSTSCSMSANELISQIAQLKKVLKKCYKHQPGIPLLLDEDKTFGIDEVFVDLELITQNKSNQQDKEGAQSETLLSRNDEENFYERREFKWDEETQKKAIEPEDLFKEEEKLVQRVFLQGAAGIGKTTLCRHLAYTWAKERLWENDFELVIYLPLREIVVAYDQKKYNLETFILGNWVESATLGQGDDYGKPLITDSQQQALWQFIQTLPTKVLWLLDGLDEVDREHPAIKALLSYAPCYLVTSRPASAPKGIKRCVENIGLSPANRKRYIKRYFMLLQEEEKAKPLMHWLKSNIQVWGLSSIAVICQLLCIAFQKNQQLPNDLSLTQLYDLLIIQWQRRAFLRDKALQGKLKSDELAEWDENQIATYYNDLTQILSKICYRALEQTSGVLIEGALLKEVIEESIHITNTAMTAKAKAEAQIAAMHDLRVELLSLGVLKAQGLSTNPYQDRYEFVHLTFVEFLAANYVVKVLTTKASPNTLYAMLEKKSIIALFTAGLLAKQTTPNHEFLHPFFAHLTPYYTSKGMLHQLALCYMEANLPELQQLSNGIEMAIKKEIKGLLKDNSLKWAFIKALDAYQMLNSILIQKLDLLDDVSKALYLPNSNKEFALHLIYKVKHFFKGLELLLLSLADKIYNWNILIGIATEMQLGNEYSKALLSKILMQNPHLNLRDINSIIKRLINLGVLNDEVIDMLLKRLNNENIREIKSIIIVLKKLGINDERIISPLLMRLQDKDSGVIREVTELLIKLGISDERLINPLLEHLQNKNSRVIRVVAESLIKLGISDERLINPLLEHLQDKDRGLRVVTELLIRLGISDERLLNPLLGRLQDKDWLVINEVVGLLIKLGVTDERLVKPLSGRLQDKDVKIVNVADAYLKILALSIESVSSLDQQAALNAIKSKLTSYISIMQCLGGALLNSYEQTRGKFPKLNPTTEGYIDILHELSDQVTCLAFPEIKSATKSEDKKDRNRFFVTTYFNNRGGFWSEVEGLRKQQVSVVFDQNDQLDDGDESPSPID